MTMVWFYADRDFSSFGRRARNANRVLQPLRRPRVVGFWRDLPCLGSVHAVPVE